MNTEELKKRCFLLKKNQKKLKFEIQISQDEQKFIHVVTTVEKRYEKSLNKMLNGLILEALKIGLNLFDLRNITEELQESYIEQWTNVFDCKKADFISVLIKDGVDMYVATVMDAAYKLNLIFAKPEEKAA